MKSLLLAFPHPDDESFTCGGVVPKYTDLGWNVHYLCATRGEIGNRGPYRETKEPLGAIRERELGHACEILGISHCEFLGYKDGSLAKTPAGELEDELYKHLMSIKPDTVITFEPQGISNHPDHKKMTISTTYAFQKYARAALSPGYPKKIRGRSKITQEMKEKAASVDQPKLYYACLPEGVANFLKEKKVLPELSFGAPMHAIPDSNITTIVNISRYEKKKIMALRAHQTQQADVDRFLSVDPQPLTRQEFFILRMIGIHEHFMGKHDRVRDRL